MNSAKTHGGTTLYLLGIALAALLFSGCAAKRWQGSLEEEARAGISARLAAIQGLEKECPDSLDADALIFWESPMEEWAVEGYLQLLPPSFVKLIITNPLGQPVYAFAGNGEDYQILQPGQQRHIRGKLRSLAIHKDIPQALARGDWFAYLTGRLPARPLNLSEINAGLSEGTVWLQISPATSDITGESVWLHFDPEQEEVLGYLFLDGGGGTLAEISYGDGGERQNRCGAAKETLVTGLPWGATLRVQLQEVSSDNQFSADDFALPVPAGYSTQLRP